VYNNNIEAIESYWEEQKGTNADIARINDRFVYAFYCGLPSDNRTLLGNDLSLTKMYEMVEKANQEFEVRYESQEAYTSSRRFPRYEFGQKPSSDGRMDKSKKQSAGFAWIIEWTDTSRFKQ